MFHINNVISKSGLVSDTRIYVFYIHLIYIRLPILKFLKLFPSSQCASLSACFFFILCVSLFFCRCCKVSCPSFYLKKYINFFYLSLPFSFSLSLFSIHKINYKYVFLKSLDNEMMIACME